jgi:hypothetical protein
MKTLRLFLLFILFSMPVASVAQTPAINGHWRMSTTPPLGMWNGANRILGDRTMPIDLTLSDDNRLTGTFGSTGVGGRMTGSRFVLLSEPRAQLRSSRQIIWFRIEGLIMVHPEFPGRVERRILTGTISDLRPGGTTRPFRAER